MTTELFLFSFASAIGLFMFMRIVKLEFEVAKLNSLVNYLMDRGTNGQ